MEPAKRTELTQRLAVLVAEMAAAIRPRMVERGSVRERALKLHADEHVGEDFEVWTDLLARRAAVLWVLKSVYVRVLEDRGLLRPRRIVDSDSPELFARLAPNLGDTAYLGWVYRDLAADEGGLPELFAPQAAEVAAIPDALSRALLEFWRARDPDTGDLHYRFDEELFDGRLMGDLYEDLDPVVKARFALRQTPDFILDFILDQTLTPAIEEFGIETVRVLDPACGSGHFLLAAFKRLVAGMQTKHPERLLAEVVGDCLARVVGIDLNDYACALARARLVMTALELLGEKDFSVASQLHPQVFWADALEQIELDDAQGQMFAAGKPFASLTQSEVRAKLRPLLEQKFHAIVANPPYITEKDASRKAYHREKVGHGKKKRQRYASAYQKYSLAAPFTERMLDLTIENGFMGEITANSFMKREFGKVLIQDVLPRHRMTKVVDTAGAHIPAHGTPTVILFARRQPPGTDPVPVVMGKRGEPGKPLVAAEGSVWRSIVAGHEHPGFENEFISVAAVERSVLAAHPWSIGGGGAAELTTALEQDRGRIGGQAQHVGITAVTGEDAVYAAPTQRDMSRRGVVHTVSLLVGEFFRNWGCEGALCAAWPFDGSLAVAAEADCPDVVRYLKPFRPVLSQRKRFGTPMLERGLTWYEWQELYADKLRTPLTIAYGEVATHNHFVLDRGGKVFKQTAPVIKLPPGSTEAEHLCLLAQLNSSTACFWLKQVCQNKGSQGINEGLKAEHWEQFYQFGATKLESFPLAATRDSTLESFAARLDGLARQRVDRSARTVIDGKAAAGAAILRSALDSRREEDLADLRQMVGLQEELDWRCYRLYGIDPAAPEGELRAPDQVPPLTPGERAFEITLAQEDASRREAIANGEEPDEQPTAWFERHGWQPIADANSIPKEWRDVTRARLERTEASRDLGLVEQATYKRRWYRPDYQKEEQEALAEWFADRVEDAAKKYARPFTARELTVTLQDDAAVGAVAELISGSGSFDLERMVASTLWSESVPNVKHHVYKPKGLTVRAAWEKTWLLQHEEDAWEAQHARHKADPEHHAAPTGPRPQPAPAPKYGSGDFLRAEYWKHRGKLDVPKERFIAFTEVPSAEQPLYGWAGWTATQRAKALLELDERAEATGAKLEERYALLWGVQFLLPYVSWDDEGAAAEFRAILRDVVGVDGVTDALLAAWAERHPPPKPPPAATAAKSKSPAAPRKAKR
ncbi:MAG: BREX-2 system adenine-specific DNA-methyltransferase PglX [Polyangiaceae bacterium]|nr:BREX-2 system adenine-specific DNA-methyltransferase PglX [Polyangiaceae bacterium]